MGYFICDKESMYYFVFIFEHILTLSVHPVSFAILYTLFDSLNHCSKR